MKRGQVFARDGYRCVYCGGVFPEEELTVDHVEPRVRGGDHSGGNVVTACGGCNTLKGSRRLAHFLCDSELAHASFRRYATHVWKRHLRALEDEIRSRRGAGSRDARHDA